MRIHIQNGQNMSTEVTPEIWEAAAARAEASGTGHVVTFGGAADEFHSAIGEAEVVISGGGSLAKLLPFKAPRLKIIFCTSAGVDQLLPFDWLPTGALVANNRGVHAIKTGEYAAMALMMLNTRMPSFIANQHAQSWKKQMTPSFRGRRVTVVGSGVLGGASAAQARHFGAIVTGVSRSGAAHADFDHMVASDALDSVLPTTDYLIMACPLTPETRELLNRRRIGLLPKGAGVINVGRGELIEQDALCDALDAGHLGGAVLDVFVPEPLPPGHRVWTTPNLVVTPHVAAGDPLTYYADTMDIFFSNLKQFQAGQTMSNLVDTQRGY
jgi:glyoxylate/hydroxypyruvate reductase